MPSISDEIAGWRTAEAARKVEMSQWLTLHEVAALTKLPERTLRLYVETGQLRAFKAATSSQLRFRAEDVERMFKPVQPKVGA